MSEQTRGWVYRIALVAIAALGIFGVVTEEQGAQLVALVTALLGVGATALATRNTPGPLGK